MSNQPEKKSGKVNYFRVLAGGYLVYLAFQLLRDASKSGTPVVGIIGGVVFAAVGGLLLLREWKAYKYGLDHIDDPETWSDGELPEAEEEQALPEAAADPDEPAEEDGV